jgi:hypothetical protein
MYEIYLFKNLGIQIVHSRLTDMKSKIIDEDDESFHKPTEEEVNETTEATRQALEKITTAKVYWKHPPYSYDDD